MDQDVPEHASKTCGNPANSSVALVISADPACCKSIAGIISECGLPAVCCQTVREGQSALQCQNLAVVFCSDALPDGDFRAVLAAAKRSLASPPLIVLSRVAEWDAYLAALGAGAFDYIACPPTRAETHRILGCALNGSTELPLAVRVAC